MFARIVLLSCIFGLTTTSSVCAELPKADSPLRVVLRPEGLYTVVVSGDVPRKADLVSVSLDGRARVQRHALYLSSLKGYPLVWDIAGDRIVALSVGEQVPGQKTFSLVSTPLGDLKSADSAEVVRGHPRLHDLLLPGPEPLIQAMFEAELQETGTVLYDLAASAEGRISFAVLAKGTLGVWHLARAREFTGQADRLDETGPGDEWRSAGSFETTKSKPFRLLVQADDFFVAWSDGSMGRVGRTTLSPVSGTTIMRPALVIDDKRKRRPVLLFGSDSSPGSIDYSRSLAIHDDQTLPAAVEADVQHALAVLQTALGGE